jgi:predicted dienelactone hydrolase
VKITNPRRLNTILGLIIIAALIIAGIIFYPHSTKNLKSTTTTVSTTNKPGATTTTVANAFGIGLATYYMVIPSTKAQIELLVGYPASLAKKSPVQNATPDKAGAPYPLIMFSQGFGISIYDYAELIGFWIEHGYVVADVIYPYTDPSYLQGLNRNDIVNHPSELTYAITEMLNLNGSNTIIRGLINPNQIAVAGQSDGGDVSLAAAFNTQYFDSRIKLALILSGAEYAAFGGKYFSVDNIPLFLSQGSSDTINPPYCSVQIYDEAKQPKFYLNLINADHLEPYTDQTSPYAKAVRQSTLDFLNYYFKRSNVTLNTMYSDGTINGVSNFYEQNYITPPNYNCPGAP